MVDYLKNFYNKYKHEVFVSLLASAVTAAIIKSWEWLISTAPVYGRSIITAIENITYSLAATQTTTTLTRTIISCLLGLFLGWYSSIIYEGVSALKPTKKLEKATRSFPHSNSTVKGNDTDKNAHVTPIDQQIASLSKKVKHGIFVLSITAFVIYILVHTIVLKPAQLWSDFNNDITAIAPYVEEQEILQLKSDWVCMREKSDYIEIYQTIDAIKNEHSLP